MESVLLLAAGARAAERVLLERLDAELASPSPQPLDRLALPVRVVVPSNSLRRHVAAAVVGHRRRAVLGLQVQTLHALAVEVLERWGEPPPLAGGRGGDLAAELLTRRFAAAEPELARTLGSLQDPWGAVAATVRDLLDAGLEPPHAGPAEENLEQGPGSAAQRRRARALVRVAARVAAELERLGTLRHGDLLRRAADRLARDPERALPARAVLIHGFADATGVATDLLEALVRHRDAAVLVDLPPDPADPERQEEAFAARLRDRLGSSARSSATAGPAGAVEIHRWRAPGGEAEALAVARCLRELIDGGERPEGIGLLARDLAPHRAALRRHLTALGVPFSGLDEPGAATGGTRRARFLLDLLARRGSLAADRWLQMRGGGGRPEDGADDGGRRVDLRLALYARGAGRLADVAALEVDPDRSYPLPLRRGLAAPDAEAADGGDPGDEPEPPETAPGVSAETSAQGTGPGTGSPPHVSAETSRRGASAPRRWISGRVLARTAASAASLLRRLEGWPEARAVEHAAALRRLLRQDLRWRPDDGAAPGSGAGPVFAAVDRLERELPPGLVLDLDELRLVLARLLADAGRALLGGNGGGVQVLSAMSARGRTWEWLFALGVHRGAFPRVVRQDPLLPDALRGSLRVTMPDLPLKGGGHEEERHLFAELLSASPRVVLSSWSSDDEGTPVAPSPLVERLAAARGAGEPVDLPAPWALAGPEDPPEPRTARQAAILAAVHGADRDRIEALLAATIEETRRDAPAPSAAAPPAATPAATDTAAPAPAVTGPAVTAPAPAAHRPAGARVLAAVRRRVLDELDPALGSEQRRQLGPYFGFLGGGVPGGGGLAGDGAAPWVTQAESLARCGWQTFLQKGLRLEPAPDPLLTLPALDGLLLGNLVHRMLEWIARGAPEAGLAAAGGGRRRGERDAPTLDAALAPAPPPGADPLPGAGSLPVASPLTDANPVVASPVVASPLSVASRWPEPALLEVELQRQARALLEEEGVALSGLARALAEQARPVLERAREDWHAAGGVLEVLGCEVTGTVRVGGGAALRFKADRVDRAAGRLRLTDYKTGRPLDPRKGAHAAKLAAGQLLQATAYRLAAEQIAGEAAAGRYLFLGAEGEGREVVDAGEPELAQAFEAAVAAILHAWGAGTFFPRVVDPSGTREPATCRWCQVAEACLRGDSGARRRLIDWTARAPTPGESPAEAALRALWPVAENK